MNFKRQDYFYKKMTKAFWSKCDKKRLKIRFLKCPFDPIAQFLIIFIKYDLGSLHGLM